MTDPAPSDQAETDRYWREVIVPRVAAARAEREHVLAGREDLVSRVEALLFYEDPNGSIGRSRGLLSAIGLPLKASGVYGPLVRVGAIRSPHEREGQALSWMNRRSRAISPQ
jgi:hypothetical protein